MVVDKELDVLTKFVDDIKKISEIDGSDGHLVDAVIEKFCNENFANSERSHQAMTALKIGIHSAMEDGLSRDEILASISQAGNTINPKSPMAAWPTVFQDRAEALTGEDNSHLHEGIIQFIGATGTPSTGPTPVAERAWRAVEIAPTANAGPSPH